MTNKEANRIFRQKYPTGTIFSKGKFGGVSGCKYAVEFTEHGKIYSFFEPNYTSLLVRLGCMEDPLCVDPEYLKLCTIFRVALD